MILVSDKSQHCTAIRAAGKSKSIEFFLKYKSASFRMSFFERSSSVSLYNPTEEAALQYFAIKTNKSSNSIVLVSIVDTKLYFSLINSHRSIISIMSVPSVQKDISACLKLTTVDSIYLNYAIYTIFFSIMRLPYVQLYAVSHYDNE